VATVVVFPKASQITILNRTLVADMPIECAGTGRSTGFVPAVDSERLSCDGRLRR